MQVDLQRIADLGNNLDLMHLEDKEEADCIRTALCKTTLLWNCCGHSLWVLGVDITLPKHIYLILPAPLQCNISQHHFWHFIWKSHTIRFYTFSSHLHHKDNARSVVADQEHCLHCHCIVAVQDLTMSFQWTLLQLLKSCSYLAVIKYQN